MTTIALSFAELSEFWQLQLSQQEALISKCIEGFAQTIEPIDEDSAKNMLLEDYGGRLSSNRITTVSETIDFMYTATIRYRTREKQALEILRAHLHNQSEAIAALRRHSQINVES